MFAYIHRPLELCLRYSLTNILMCLSGTASAKHTPSTIYGTTLTIHYNIIEPMKRLLHKHLCLHAATVMTLIVVDVADTQ